MYVRLNKEKKMKKYEPTNKALAIAEIRHQTGLNYTECKKILDQIENRRDGK
jgi:CRISPR/Cas system CSM-associated protein Csm2 small subunit